jgi:hypothetical protein
MAHGSWLVARLSRSTLHALILAFLLLPTPSAAETRIIRLVPETGPTRGGTTVRIYVAGAGLAGPVEVQFGDRVAAKVRRLSLTAVEAVTPPGVPGPVAVQIVNELSGTITLPGVFTYVPTPPQISQVVPSSLLAGSEEGRIQIDGSDFPPGAVVLVNDTPLPTAALAPERLQAIVPAWLLAGPRTLEVRVADVDPGGETSDAATLVVVNPAPQLTGVDVPPLNPKDPAGIVIVRGMGFRPDSRIELAGQATGTRYRSAVELEGSLPLALLETNDRLSVRVMTPGPGGGLSNPWTLTIVAPPPPPPPPPPPIPGRFVVFTSNRDGGRNHIYLLDRQSQRLDPLEEANNPHASDGYPSISGDGRFIVFQSNRHRGQHDIFLFDRETRTLDLLPEANHPTAFDGFPKISPDGRIIVFESDRLNGRPKVFLFDRQTRTLSELSQANEATADDGLAAISN